MRLRPNQRRKSGRKLIKVKALGCGREGSHNIVDMRAGNLFVQRLGLVLDYLLQLVGHVAGSQASVQPARTRDVAAGWRFRGLPRTTDDAGHLVGLTSSVPVEVGLGGR